jgi:hypothetical protein
MVKKRNLESIPTIGIYWIEFSSFNWLFKEQELNLLLEYNTIVYLGHFQYLYINFILFRTLVHLALGDLMMVCRWYLDDTSP